MEKLLSFVFCYFVQLLIMNMQPLSLFAFLVFCRAKMEGEYGRSLSKASQSPKEKGEIGWVQCSPLRQQSGSFERADFLLPESENSAR